MTWPGVIAPQGKRAIAQYVLDRSSPDIGALRISGCETHRVAPQIVEYQAGGILAVICGVCKESLGIRLDEEDAEPLERRRTARPDATTETVMRLRSPCHPDAATFVAYEDGELVVTCRCKNLVASLMVYDDLDEHQVGGM